MARWKGTVLSDEYFMKHCKEYMPMKVGLAQTLYPYMSSTLDGVQTPSVLPTAQRGYELSTFALELSRRSQVDYDTVLQRVKSAQEQLKLPEVKRPTQSVKVGGGKRDQPSLLAVSVKPRESDYSQLNRKREATGPTGPTGPPPDQTGSTTPPPDTAETGVTYGQYMPKTGKLPKEPVASPQKDEI